jgi:hypothetical protein
VRYPPTPRNSGCRICRPQLISSTGSHGRRGAVTEGSIARATRRREMAKRSAAFSRHERPGCARHTACFRHRRRTTISLECYPSLLSLGKSRRARPDVAFRGRVGGGWGRENGVRGRPPARMQPAGAPTARSGRGRRHRRELALGGGGDRGRVAAVTDRGRRAGSGPARIELAETENCVLAYTARARK